MTASLDRTDLASATLLVLSGPARGSRIEVPAGGLVFGRAAGCSRPARRRPGAVPLARPARPRRRGACCGGPCLHQRNPPQRAADQRASAGPAGRRRNGRYLPTAGAAASSAPRATARVRHHRPAGAGRRAPRTTGPGHRAAGPNATTPPGPRRIAGRVPGRADLRRASGRRAAGPGPCRRASGRRAAGPGPCRRASGRRAAGPGPCRRASGRRASGPGPCGRASGPGPCGRASGPGPCGRAAGPGPCGRASGPGPCGRASGPGPCGRASGPGPCGRASGPGPCGRAAGPGPCGRASGPGPCGRASGRRAAGPNATPPGPRRIAGCAGPRRARGRRAAGPNATPPGARRSVGLHRRAAGAGRRPAPGSRRSQRAKPPEPGRSRGANPRAGERLARHACASGSCPSPSAPGTCSPVNATGVAKPISRPIEAYNPFHHRQQGPYA